jgi:transcriptional regulator with XRE-family HTH domain
MKTSEWREIFGNNLASILQEKKMSQAQLAKDSGVSTGMISDYINKRAMPGLVPIINIAYALDMEVSELIDFGDRVNY